VSSAYPELLLTSGRPTQNVAIRIAIDLDIFSLVDECVPLDGLASKTGADPSLLYRVLRLLVATDVLKEPEPKRYSATPLSRLIRTPSIRDWFKTSFDSLLPIWVSIPAWLRENGYKDITDLENNPTLSLHGMSFWEWHVKNPQLEADFASAMKFNEAIPKQFVAQFPWDEGAAESDCKADVFVVDVGGGQGQFLSRIIQEHPYLPGRKVLQDQPSVAAGAAKDALFESQGYDFFTPQPIQGAKYYHFRGIFLNWPDDSCVTILKNTQAAMIAGYSRILIEDFILPEYGVGVKEASLDLNMWVHVGKQRTGEEWKALLAKAGLKVVRTLMPEAGVRGIIEADLA
jgi:hypothetical protein